MSFNFDKFVQRHTRTLFSFIVVTMVLPLVLWGYMGGGADRDEDKTSAGKIYGTIDINKSEFNRQLGRSTASWWWKKYNDRLTMMMMQYGQRPKPPTTEELQKQAWEDIVLLREAKSLGITASETEALMFEKDLYQKFTRSYDYKTEIMNQIASSAFHVPLATLQAWTYDAVAIDKLLNLVSESQFADYDKVYAEILKGQQMAKVWYVGFDPKDYLRELKPPSTDEIAAYYQKNKDKYKVPAKIQVAYLMADTDELKKAIAEPTDADVKKYYDDHKAEFSLPHEHKEGEDHKEGEEQKYKPFDDVKAEIPAKIKQAAAGKQAADIMSRVDVALGAIATQNAGKYPDDVFDQLKKKFKEEKVELSYDVTTAFDPKQVEDVEKTVGTDSNLASWGFDPALKVGDVSQKTRTSKGVALFRLQKKVDALDPGITDRTREAIVKELQKEQIRKKTAQIAANVVQEISTRGMAAARLKYPLDWRLTRYFKVGGGNDSGIDDPSLAQAINQQLQSQQLTAGKASVIGGAMLRSREKADWSYVVYLDDLVDGKPEDVAGQFPQLRKSLDAEVRQQGRENYVTEKVREANVLPDKSLKNSENSSAPAPQP